MIADITHQGRTFRVDLERPLDLSLPLHDGKGQVRAWWVDPVRMEPALWKGRPCMVKDGSATNFRNVFFNPHGHGTHTESVGHIAPEIHPVGPLLQRYFFTAQVVSVKPEQRRVKEMKVDRVITLAQLQAQLGDGATEALVIRTLPNEADKRMRDWSGTNACYLEAAAATWLRERGVLHILLDLPSVDREEDEGALAAHHAFWDFPRTLDTQRTISELLFVPDEVADGHYLLELQVPNFMNDAAPSRPVLYALL